MSQHDFDIANQTFPAFRSDLNNALQALVTSSAGASAPSTTFAYQLWYDSTNDILKMRNADDDAWITLFTFDQATDSVQVSGEELVDDTSPQLGGDLDVNGNSIISTSNGDITINPNGTGEIILDAKVGIGTSSPAVDLEVSGSIAASDSATSTKRLQLDAGATSHTINSANYGSDMMDLNVQAENLIFKTGLVGVAERMRILSSGGITFNGDTAAANALDDYEEGTFTPTLLLDSGSATITSSGSYVKVGKKVTVTISVAINTSSGSPAIDKIGGMPFTPENADPRAVGTLRENGVTGHTWHIRASKNQTNFLVRRYDGTQAIGTNYHFMGSVTYITS